MERVAVITDIHANLAALEAVLEAIERTGVDALYCGGDLVGYGPHPNDVCRLIEKRGIPTIYGNYDYAIARDLEDCGCAYRDQHDRELGQLSVAWTLEHTDQQSKDFMRGLPFDLRFELGRRRIRLVHGSPRKVNEYLFKDKPARGSPSFGLPTEPQFTNRTPACSRSQGLWVWPNTSTSASSAAARRS
jgi:predicted phosphodiesterase